MLLTCYAVLLCFIPVIHNIQLMHLIDLPIGVLLLSKNWVYLPRKKPNFVQIDFTRLHLPPPPTPAMSRDSRQISTGLKGRAVNVLGLALHISSMRPNSLLRWVMFLLAGLKTLLLVVSIHLFECHYLWVLCDGWNFTWYTTGDRLAQTVIGALGHQILQTILDFSAPTVADKTNRSIDDVTSLFR